MDKTMVAYFSVSGVTARAARAIAQVTGGDLFEIVAKEPYTAADVDWTNKRSRSSLEERDASIRPELAAHPEGMEAYDTVFVGYPVWWGHEPAIVDTFLEACDLAGKLVVPFCTSGSSGASGADARLRRVCGAGVDLRPAKLVNGMGIEALRTWVEDL